jgi:hypothetical protein
MSLADELQKQREREDAERAAWALGDYTGEDCERCGRARVCRCPNGKRRCEKCNWCPEDCDYAPTA